MIRLGELVDSSFISRRVGNVRMVTCAAPSYLEKYGIPMTPDDLIHHKAISFFSEHSREVMEWKFAMNGEVISRNPGSNMLVNNSDVLLSCCPAVLLSCCPAVLRVGGAGHDSCVADCTGAAHPVRQVEGSINRLCNHHQTRVHFVP